MKRRARQARRARPGSARLIALTRSGRADRSRAARNAIWFSQANPKFSPNSGQIRPSLGQRKHKENPWISFAELSLFNRLRRPPGLFFSCVAASGIRVDHDEQRTSDKSARPQRSQTAGRCGHGELKLAQDSVLRKHYFEKTEWRDGPAATSDLPRIAVHGLPGVTALAKGSNCVGIVVRFGGSPPFPLGAPALQSASRTKPARGREGSH